MAFPQGIDFRGSLGFVTDPTNCFGIFGPNSGSGIYPQTTTQGNTVGWVTNVGVSSQADRSAAVDARLAGINYVLTTINDDFRIDLPSTGSYTLSAAWGDQAFGQTGMTTQFKDNTTVLSTPVSAGAPGANQYYDAGGTLRTSDTDWVNNNASVTFSFATTTFLTNIACGIGGTACVIAHLFVQAASGAAAVLPPFLFMEGEENLI